MTYFRDGRTGGAGAYGKAERLHMVYNVDGEPKDYSLPEPVPLNTVASHLAWKWLMGLLPGGILLAWLWKKAEARGEDHE